MAGMLMWHTFQEDTQRVIYAISPDGSDDLKYHTASYRGARSLYLRSKVGAQAQIPEDSFTFDITIDNVRVKTVWRCSFDLI